MQPAIKKKKHFSGEVELSFFVAGAVFGEVAVSLFVAGTVSREI